MAKKKKVSRDIAGICLGQIAERYSMHCSEECPKAGICAVIAIGCYLRQVVRESSPEESIDNQS